MLGAIYGDIVGSIYEYDQFKEIKEVNPKQLILPDSFYSDDTIETVAVIDAILNSKNYEKTLKQYILENLSYKPDFSPCFKNPFSPNTIKWAKGLAVGNSNGNGAMMRISPVGYLFDNEDEVKENAYLVTATSHNSSEAIESATIIALMIYYFRNGMSKEETYSKLKLPVIYQPFLKFNTTCKETLNNCLYAIYNSKSFEDAVRRILLMGGDTDTNCCIVGAVAESLYGIDDRQKDDVIEKLPLEYTKVLKKAYK